MGIDMSAVEVMERYELVEQSLRADVRHGVINPGTEMIADDFSVHQIMKWCEENRFDECEIGRLVKDKYEAHLESVVDELI
jgi:hypothetical protein